MAFVKLDTGILDSSLWMDRVSREIFITSLLMATPHEVTEPIPQLKVRALEPTGFVVPPGWYGFIKAAGVGIVNRSLVDLELGLNALEKLGDPEHESRSQDHEGRRLVRVDGGYIVLNYFKYRDKDNSAERQRRLRERRNMSRVTHRDVTRDNPVTSRIAEAEAEAEEDTEQCKNTKPPTSVPDVHPLPPHPAGTAPSAGADVKPKKVKSAELPTRIPLPFVLTDDMRTWATENVPGLDLATETAEFEDYWKGVPGARGKKLDWVATWRNRLRDVTKRAPRGAARPSFMSGIPEVRVHRKFGQ